MGNWGLYALSDLKILFSNLRLSLASAVSWNRSISKKTDRMKERDLAFWHLLIDHLSELIFPSFFSSAEHVKSLQFQLVLLCQVIKDALTWRASG